MSNLIKSNILPWHVTQWDSLLANSANLPHALLLAGPGGIGKSGFAQALAARLLCESPEDNRACGRCEACHWLATGNHPDFRKVTLEVDEPEGEEGATGKTSAKKTAPATQIKVDQIRALEDFIFIGSHRNGNRVVIVDPADAMNTAAANSILKILEEPPASVYFIMVSSKWRNLLPTLRSRCRKVLFGTPAAAEAAAWLKQAGVADAESELALAGGAPLKAKLRSERGAKDSTTQILAPMDKLPLDPLALAAHWDAQLRANSDLTLEILVDTVQKWLYDLIRVNAAASPRYLSSKASQVARIAGNADPIRLQRCHASLLKIRATARHPLNTMLFLEDLAARCAVAVTPNRN
ncbi:DNA polymerase III subunit delta' [Denitratisoma sp. DHT3]|uniref:DNA polymerase III subunit delta' n=1 Tax=Denitratisoma sp. DHT3 TaxID=1981880 RepID=UPI0011982EE7|nr:DNA polymerase III subunit delta' [Denitratisoma sp. DHT3]QDX80438.1 DNA polymerase III subunit delta' [Denitratisoma sp. DHT3]